MRNTNSEARINTPRNPERRDPQYDPRGGTSATQRVVEKTKDAVHKALSRK